MGSALVGIAFAGVGCAIFTRGSKYLWGDGWAAIAQGATYQGFGIGLVAIGAGLLVT